VLDSNYVSGTPRFVTTDVAECRKYIREATGTHRFDVTRSSRLLEFAHHESSVGRISLNFVNMACTDGFFITKAGSADYYSFQFLLGGSCQLEGSFGRVVAKAGDVFVLGPEYLTREFWPTGCLQFLVHVDTDVIRQVIVAELGRELKRPLNFEPVGRDPGIASWLRQIAMTAHAEPGDVDLLTDRRVMKSLERALVVMLLTGLRHDEREEFAGMIAGPAPYYVRRAEEYIRAHARDDLVIESIAEAAGVSARSVFYGFRHARNTTPMAYLRNVRLDLARRELQSARHTGGTVSRAAANAGFTNFSQFSKIYKARFGQTPSETLKSQ
jgi:AraC-like DNA-binding protein